MILSWTTVIFQGIVMTSMLFAFYDLCMWLGPLLPIISVLVLLSMLQAIIIFIPSDRTNRRDDERHNDNH